MSTSAWIWSRWRLGHERACERINVTGRPRAASPSLRGDVMSEPVGSFCLVLHSHLPWLPHHGSWPVGEEWLYQAWAHSYLPVVDLLRRFADEGRRDVLTL